jgi:hypothetical protein
LKVGPGIDVDCRCEAANYTNFVIDHEYFLYVAAPPAAIPGPYAREENAPSSADINSSISGMVVTRGGPSRITFP